jgi:hypothetical protein
VAEALAARGWRLEMVSTDDGSEFTSREFGAALARHGAVPAHPRRPAAVKRLSSSGPS